MHVHERACLTAGLTSLDRSQSGNFCVLDLGPLSPKNGPAHLRSNEIHKRRYYTHGSSIDVLNRLPTSTSEDGHLFKLRYCQNLSKNDFIFTADRSVIRNGFIQRKRGKRAVFIHRHCPRPVALFPTCLSISNICRQLDFRICCSVTYD